MPFKERLKTGSPRKREKPCYVPRDWSSYNNSLKKRGKLSLYFPAGDLKSLLINQHSYAEGVSGRQAYYSKAYVEILLIFYRMLNMGLRAFVGFMEDYWKLRGLDIDVPCFGHLSDLFAALDMTIQQKCATTAVRLKNGENIAVIMDSTGMRFSNAGAWYAKKYGKVPDRTPWRVMHLTMEAEGDILALEMTNTETGDSTGMDQMLAQLDNVGCVIADTGYYQIERNEQLLAKGIMPVIPPKSSAVDDPEHNRHHDQLVRYLAKKGHYAFQKKYGYGLRSRVEAMFSRIKRCIGETLKTRRETSQIQEGKAIANLINQWNAFGMAHCVKKA